MKVTRYQDGTIVIDGEGLHIYANDAKQEELIDLIKAPGVNCINFTTHPNENRPEYDVVSIVEAENKINLRQMSVQLAIDYVRATEPSDLLFLAESIYNYLKGKTDDPKNATKEN